MALTAEQRKAREGQFSASFAPYLMAGDEKRILNEWRLCVGDPLGKEPDLSNEWAPSLGSYLEPFILDWCEKKGMAPLTMRGERVIHPGRSWCGATLDAFRDYDGVVVDCKVVGAWRKIDEVCAYYAPQILVQRDCVGATGGSLLIVHGSAEPVEYPIHLPSDYCVRVWERIDWFWSHVESLTPPYDVEPIVAPPAPVIEYDMTGNNEWADKAEIWIGARIGYRLYESASNFLKNIVPPDARRCYGHGIEVTRNKAGSLTIKELK